MNNDITLVIHSFSKYLRSAYYASFAGKKKNKAGWATLWSSYLNGKDTFCNEQKLQLRCIMGRRSTKYFVNYYQGD